MNFTPAFPSLNFNSPTLITHAGDGRDRLYVAERVGTVRTFPNDDAVASATMFLDIRDRVSTASTDMGLLGLAFHPDYAVNGYFYVNYTMSFPTRSIISRFSRSTKNPDMADANSEVKLLEIAQPYPTNNGGALAFGPDGYLYIGMGDGGGTADPDGNGQDLTDLLGSILRIDVDNADPGLKYSIPLDNPFYSPSDGALPEIYAYGLRNPWRFSFDPLNGRLWVGDVGQDRYEEIDLIQAGGNYGWNVMEGNHCQATLGCDDTGMIPPVFEYDHSQGRCIIGGLVYRGETFPELYGLYLYGDYVVGRLWALEYDGREVQRNAELADTNYAIVSIGEDDAGEPLILDYKGQIYRLDWYTPPTTSGLPRFLSETGCFSDVQQRIPAPGVMPYEVNSPLWSDGEFKDRWFALPPGLQITYSNTGAWNFPAGAVTIKDFWIELEEGNPSSKRMIETRVFVRNSSDWKGYSYRWNEDGTDAILLESNATDTFDITRADGSTAAYTHYYPTRYECQSCHTLNVGYTLGLKAGQMNLTTTFPDGEDNQLRAYDHVGLFSAPLPGPYDQYSRYAAPLDPSQDLEKRARSYLEANCSFCHRPGGTTTATMDLRYEVSLAETKTCNVSPANGNLGVQGAMIIKPGSPELSVLALRMRTTGSDRMPPLASHVVDVEGLKVVEEWIQSLKGCF